MALFCCKPHVVTVFISGVMARKGVLETVLNGVFRHFLEELSLVLPDFFLLKGALIVLNACVKFGVQEKSGSRVRGK